LRICRTVPTPFGEKLTLGLFVILFVKIFVWSS
jgi:hypothetical protein